VVAKGVVGESGYPGHYLTLTTITLPRREKTPRSGITGRRGRFA
jgi:hypothetical protein